MISVMPTPPGGGARGRDVAGGVLFGADAADDAADDDADDAADDTAAVAFSLLAGRIRRVFVGGASCAESAAAARLRASAADNVELVLVEDAAGRTYARTFAPPLGAGSGKASPRRSFTELLALRGCTGVAGRFPSVFTIAPFVGD